jgi:enoyl-CoA hydratase/carnithine racemase
VTDHILIERPADGVALIRINRPEVHNALSMEVRSELAEQVEALDADETVRAIVITGSDKVFAAGADLAELRKRALHDKAFRTSRLAWQIIEDCRVPIIAAINGLALGGGCELALHCDIIIAGEGASLGQPEIRFGIMPGAGGTQRFLRATGKFGAMRYLLTGDYIPAEVALRMGLVSEVVPDAEVQAHAIKIASKIASLPPLAVDAIKEAVNMGADASLETGLLLERKAFQLLFGTEDREEGMGAFLEKRKPSFRGR